MRPSLALRLCVVAAYVSVVLVLSSMPGRELAQLGIPPRLWDAAHVPLFAGLTLVCLWALLGRTAGRVLLVCGACLLFSAAAEWHQRFVPGRVASLMDLRANAFGVLIGVTVWEVLRPLLGVWRGEPQQ